MKILFIIPSITGGIGSFLYQIISEFKERSIECHVVALSDYKDSVASAFQSAGMKIITLTNHEKRSIFSNINEFSKLFKITKTLKPDLLFGITFGPNSFISIIGRLLNIPSVATYHGTAGIKNHLFYKLPLEFIIGTFVSRRVCVSQYIKNIYVSRTKNKFFDVIFNGLTINTAQIKPIKKKTGCKRIISVGNLLPVKNYEIAIEAISRLHKMNLEFEYIILGDGPNRDKLIALTKKKEIFNRVKFLGNVTNVYEWLKGADIFFMTSKSEGMPMALLEAFNFGLPAVATNVGGIPEIVINKENGFLHSINDIDGLTASLKKLIIDDNIYYTFRSKSFSQSKKLSKTNMANNYLNLIDKCLKKNAVL
jgi:glycosyltransferase involved in cell wall biosynthesis